MDDGTKTAIWSFLGGGALLGLGVIDLGTVAVGYIGAAYCVGMLFTAGLVRRRWGDGK